MIKIAGIAACRAYTGLKSSNCNLGNCGNLRLNIVIQRKLVRMRPQPDCIYLLGSLVVYVRPKHFFGEYISLQQKCMIALQGVEGFFERTRH